MNATQPSVAFTTITGKASLLLPSPFRSPPGTFPRGRSASSPAYHVVADVSRPMRPAPESARPAIETVPSPAGVTGVSRTTPSPEKSRTSRVLGAPVLVTIRPPTPGSTPVAVGGGWDAGGGAPGPEAGTGEEAGVGRGAGGGAEPPQPAARAMSSNGRRHDLMVDSAARTPRRGGR